MEGLWRILPRSSAVSTARGVDQVAAGVSGHLDEADAFGVAEEAVGLGVDADKGAAKYVVGDALQGVGVCDVLNLGPGWHA